MDYKTLSKNFYNKPTVELAQSLLGKVLVHETPLGASSGIIVETEAYLGGEDPAAHAYRGMTERNKAMFGSAGHAYIYFTYGMYFCFNVTAGPEGVGHGVLIRAVEPLDGVDLMQKRRELLDEKMLASGPAKLVIALGINKELYGHDLTEKPLYIAEFKDIPDEQVVKTTRIGISEGKELPYRFYIKDNKFISKK